MKPLRPRVSLLAIAAASLAFGVVTDAAAQWAHDEKAVAMLPEYCKYTQLYTRSEYGSKDPVQIQRWQNAMGAANFMHMHHYCRGLEHTNIALYVARDKRQRDSNLNFSIREINYALRNVQPEFAMLPEMLAKKAENLMLLGKAPEAIREYGRAIERKPDYWPPYAALSDYYKDRRDAKQARQWLEKGLAAAPDALPLKRRLAELDGRPKR
jgi:tetratricopeptide (TPR) repeat protein